MFADFDEFPEPSLEPVLKVNDDPNSRTVSFSPICLIFGSSRTLDQHRIVFFLFFDRFFSSLEQLSTPILSFQNVAHTEQLRLCFDSLN